MKKIWVCKDHIKITSAGGEIKYFSKKTSSFIYNHGTLKITSGDETEFLRVEDIDSINDYPATETLLRDMTDKSFISSGYAFANDTVSINTSSTALPSISDFASYALVTIEGDLRYWLDGNDPTASEGMQRFEGDTIDLSSRYDIENFRAISTTGANVTIQVQYFD